MTRGTFLPDFNLTFVITLVFLLSVGAARPLLGAQNDDSDSPPEVAEVHVGKGYELIKVCRGTKGISSGSYSGTSSGSRPLSVGCLPFQYAQT